jgi:hypothetical protein
MKIDPNQQLNALWKALKDRNVAFEHITRDEDGFMFIELADGSVKMYSDLNHALRSIKDL